MSPYLRLGHEFPVNTLRVLDRQWILWAKSIQEQLIQPRPGVPAQRGQTQGRKARKDTPGRGGGGVRGRSLRNELQPSDQAERTPQCSRNQNSPFTVSSGSSQTTSFQKLTGPKRPMKMFANPADRYIKHTTMSTDLPSP